VIKVLSSSSSTSALSSADESRFDFALVNRKSGILVSSEKVTESKLDGLIAIDDDIIDMKADLYLDSSISAVKDSIEDLTLLNE